MHEAPEETFAVAADRGSAQWVMRPALSSVTAYYYRQHDGRLFNGIPARGVKGASLYTSASFLDIAPLKAYFDFTNRCNLTCRHCITSSSPVIDTSDELSPERIVGLVAEMASLGVLEIATGGGEPLFHSRWPMLFGAVTDSGMNLIITTNGLLLTQSVIRALKAIRPLEVRVSFDGGPKLHEHVRGANTYQRALRGLGRLIDGGISAVARLTLCRDAEHELPILFSDLQGIKATKVKVAIAKPAGRAATQAGSHLVRGIPDSHTAQKIIHLAGQHGLTVQLSADDFPLSVSDAKDPRLRDAKRQNCGAGLETCYITPRGEILGCVTMPGLGFGQLQTQSFREVWEGKVAQSYRDSAAGISGRLCDGVSRLRSDQHDIIPSGREIIPLEVIRKNRGAAPAVSNLLHRLG